jgi:hypothetical protein
MIRIDVEDYCHDCLDFCSDVVKPTRDCVIAKDGSIARVFQTDTIIRCQYRGRCTGIRRYLERKVKEENCT